MFNLQQIIEMVQTNCDIADAHHAQEMGMRNYLLGMRDFYRWANSFAWLKVTHIKANRYLKLRSLQNLSGRFWWQRYKKRIFDGRRYFIQFSQVCKNLVRVKVKLGGMLPALRVKFLNYRIGPHFFLLSVLPVYK